MRSKYGKPLKMFYIGHSCIERKVMKRNISKLVPNSLTFKYDLEQYFSVPWQTTVWFFEIIFKWEGGVLKGDNNGPQSNGLTHNNYAMLWSWL